VLRPLAFSEKITRRAVEACKGRVGQFGAAVEKVTARRQRTPCEGICGDL